MEEYDPITIEPKWQKVWEEKGFHKAVDPPSAKGGAGSEKPKKYILVEFPYPSGERLHVGHARTYCALDVIARKYRMQGKNVLFPFGWDAFGLPAENYAIETGVHPSITTERNIAAAKKQVKSWGLSFDWSREINTTDPSYYKWTQWIFLQLFKKGLAYQAEVSVNWCPKCKTNLADEEVLADGTHERCGQVTERRMQKQWLLRITNYADRLLKDLELVDYLPKIKMQQENWIGRSEGVEIQFSIFNSQLSIPVFTTRPDTLFGVTFFVLSPEHPILKKLLFTTGGPNSKKKEVFDYIETAKQKSELQRIAEIGEKTGIFTGLYALNPLSREKIPVFVADFVLSSYGTGAVMGVPGHDQRDWEFAKKYNLPIKAVVIPDKTGNHRRRRKEGKAQSLSAFSGYASVPSVIKGAFEDYGVLVNSGSYDGLQSSDAIAKITSDLEKEGLGEKDVQYHLRDWVFSRQHYWGEPIPMIFCAECAKNQVKSEKLKVKSLEWNAAGWFPVPKEDLPVELPYIGKYQPSGTGESPLANISEWVNVPCPECGGPAKRETDTMPNWAGSNWYFLRYCDPKNDRQFADFAKLKYFLPVDLYNGGMEHTTLHLLYSRFIHKFLYDCGFVPTPEPYAKRTSHGVVLGPDGQRMSKSRGNVINPDDIIKEFGADTFRVYEAFMGPFEQTVAWDPKGVEGCHRFLKRVWRLVTEEQRNKKQRTDSEIKRSLHRLTKKVTEDIEKMKFNTAIAAMMEFVKTLKDADNDAEERGMSVDDWSVFLQLLAPFAPHITEELWQNLFRVNPRLDPCPPTAAPLGAGRRARQSAFISIHQQPWPKYDPKLIEEEEVTIIVQVDGKVRERMKMSNIKCKISNEVERKARKLDKVKKYLSGEKVKDTIFVPGRLVNFVTE